VADDGGRSVAGVGLDEHAGDYAMVVEGLPVREVGVGLAGVVEGVVPGEVRWRWGGGEWTYHPPIVRLRFARSSRSPGSVLKGGTSPVLSFQKSSRW
jgi:hypothetical protein